MRGKNHEKMDAMQGNSYSDRVDSKNSDTNDENVKMILGFLFALLVVVGISINSAILHTFRHTSSLQTPVNVLIIGCVFCDIIMIIIGHPFVIASCFHGKWLFGAAWCEGYGFVITLLGVSSICILTAIAIDRYLVVTKSPFAKKITTFKAAMTILSCFGYGLLWATFPLVGWGQFVVEPGEVACGPDWANTASSSQSYAIAIVVLVFILPLTIITYCYCKIIVAVRNHTTDERSTPRSTSKEWNVALSSFLIIVTFVIAWAPYAITSIWVMINGRERLPDTVAMICPLLAKSTSFWNPLVYVAGNSHFRKAFTRTIFRRFFKNRIDNDPIANEPKPGQSVSTEEKYSK